jgi:1-deoxy-D-xylulose-5-phosphate reductoisomerase
MKNIGIVGSTGSIGTQSLDVISRNKNLFSIKFLSSHSNIDLVKQQIKDFSPEFVVLTGIKGDSEEYEGTKIFYGIKNLINIIENENLDLVLSSAVGFAGIKPTFASVKKGINVALANKESIVSGGLALLNVAKKTGSEIIPVDSEHSAIYQSLMGHNKDEVHKIILTASGGSFRNRPEDSLELVSVEETLKHPNWDMGSKITVDSATMMNKGLELIEARYLFDISPKKLDVVIHPQSIIHSIVSYKDGSMIAQMGLPDMRVPISFALGFPSRIESGSDFLDLSKGLSLSFEEPNYNKYPCLKTAIEVLNEDKNSLMIVMNAANEIAVNIFLKGNLEFIKISEIVNKTLNFFKAENIIDIDEIIRIDSLARKKALEIVDL